MHIFFGVLNWGLGHASRSIPIISHLLSQGHNCIIASDGNALDLLKLEFSLQSKVTFISLPEYGILYNKATVEASFISALPRVLSAIWKEKRILKQLVKSEQIDAVISDNRLGVLSRRVPSVYITHQLHIKTKNKFSSFLASRIHRAFYSAFSEIWIPDDSKFQLAGDLSRSEDTKMRYLGLISKNAKTGDKVNWERPMLLVLSGPEPGRTVLEKRLLFQLNNMKHPSILLRGRPNTEETLQTAPHVKIVNFADSSALKALFEDSSILIARSGYSTLMDLCKSRKPAILIPTPGQSEQEYLANYLEAKLPIVFKEEEELDIEKDILELKNLMKNISFPYLDFNQYKETIDLWLQSIDC